MSTNSGSLIERAVRSGPTQRSARASCLTIPSSLFHPIAVRHDLYMQESPNESSTIEDTPHPPLGPSPGMTRAGTGDPTMSLETGARPVVSGSA